MTPSRQVAILFAVLAAVLYAASAPFSKLLLQSASPAMLAAFLYIGAGTGMGIMLSSRNLLHAGGSEKKLSGSDTPYVIAMVALDIAAPLLLMFGLKNTEASNASLLNNFEIVATALIAMLLFHEKVGKRLWAAIGFVTAACMMLSINVQGSFSFSTGSLLVIGATVCWGLENNCTRQIAGKDPMQIVTIKGLGSGAGAFVIALCAGESVPAVNIVLAIMLLGFISYGLSIFFYTYSQRVIGAARTSTYYAVAPFIGSLLSFILLGEKISLLFCVALVLMLIGAWLAAAKSD